MIATSRPAATAVTLLGGQDCSAYAWLPSGRRKLSFSYRSISHPLVRASVYETGSPR